MWTHIAVLICLAAGLLAAPERSDGGLSCPRSQGLFAHPTDCHLFVHCDHDHPYVKECPANLHFNPTLMVCDWPENAGCTPGTPTDPPTPDVDPEPGMECDCECCLKPDPNDCTKYYMCKDGKAYPESCSSGLVFNPNIQNCDLASNYQCDKPSSKTTPGPVTTKATSPKPADFDCPTSDGLFPNPKDCHTFYHCSNGYAYLKDCPANLDFNPTLLVCDWPDQAGCRSTPSPKPTTPKVTTPTPADFDCPTASGLFPNPKDCHTFYHCSNGYAYLKDCPANLDFNPTLLVCDWPDQAGCRSTPSPKPTTPKVTTPTPADFDCPTDSGLFPNPKDCHTFYHCSNGYAYLKDCPANLEFNPVLLVCDWPDKAGCSNKTTPTTPAAPTTPRPSPTTPRPSPTTPRPSPTTPRPSPTTTKKSGFDCPTSNGLFPNPKDCHTFYHCSNGHAYLKDCPANLEFNPVLLVCDWPENAGCNGKPTPSPEPTSIPPPTPTASPDVICPDDTCVCRLPDPKNCSCFYQCHDGAAFQECCPAGLHFNKDTEVCDLPENVDCNPVTTPKPSTTTPKPTTTQKPTTTPKPTTTQKPTTTPKPTTTQMPTTTPKPTTTTPAPPPPCTFPCSKSDGFYGNPLNCGTYFQCSGGQATIHYCPSDKHFNTGTNACDAPESAGCCDL